MITAEAVDNHLNLQRLLGPICPTGGWIGTRRRRQGFLAAEVLHQLMSLCQKLKVSRIGFHTKQVSYHRSPVISPHNHIAPQLESNRHSYIRLTHTHIYRSTLNIQLLGPDEAFFVIWHFSFLRNHGRRKWSRNPSRSPGKKKHLN